MVYSDYVQQTDSFISQAGLESSVHSEGSSQRRHQRFACRYTQAAGEVPENGISTGSGRPLKVTEMIKTIVKEQMRTDDKTSASQLQKILTDRGFHVSLRTILCDLPRERILRDVIKTKKLPRTCTAI